MHHTDLERKGLSAELTDLDGIPMIRACGEIDLYNVSIFEESMRQAVDKGTKAVVADLSGVAYLDSSGLSALIVAYKALHVRDARLYVIAPPERYAVRRVLEITRIDHFISVKDSVNAVREDLGKRLDPPSTLLF